VEIQTQRYQVYAESNSFYRNLEHLFAFESLPQNQSRKQFLENPNRKYYSNQTQIPNILKRNTCTRAMVVQRIWNMNEINFVNLLPIPVVRGIGTILLHIPIEGVQLILHVDQIIETIPLQARKTYILFLEEIIRLKISIQTNHVPCIISMELIQLYQEHTFPSADAVFKLPIDKESWDNHLSFTLSPIFNEATQLIFLSSRFVHEYDGTPNLADITILDHLGVTILKTFVCPRKQIIHYGDSSLGLSCYTLTNQKDLWDIYPKISRILSNKIIIGVQVANQLSKMRIDPSTIRGIRDLSTATACQEYLGKRKPWPIRDLAIACGEYRNLKTTFDEASVIYCVYKKVEPKWKDDIAPWEKDMLKIPWEIVNKFAMHYFPVVNLAKTPQSPIIEKEHISQSQNTERITDPEVLPTSRITDSNEKTSKDSSDDSGDEIWLDPMAEEECV